MSGVSALTGDISENFSWREFTCRDGTPVPGIYRDNVVRLAENVLQPLRDYLGVSIRVVSGYRTPAYNKRCGGVKNSQHLKALAADIQVAGIGPKKLNAIVKKFMDDRLKETGRGGGVGWYKTFTHVDIRDAKRVMFWDKK